MRCRICGRVEPGTGEYCQYCEDAYGGEYIADLCEECGGKVTRRIYRNSEDGYENWETVCKCGIYTD